MVGANGGAEMTIVAVWLANTYTNQSLIECVADSRVTDEDSNHTLSQLLNNSAKIFSIPVVERCPGLSGNTTNSTTLIHSD